ncbi:Vtc5p SCDLUD_001654 [Saccharomycodes ludwigii]|uniref:Vtc5p n=1 Tax=Saccharomycodes ludwigii TaxID=36035 RepID=UPI001E8B67FD|nr:hypothetical protein SCDLUD_001654 [Saccharomycodes ludwigii]KAH3901870.1 hypothetical protein SCDLUD_001654 [Saccharomycodes ludwigii]
MEGQTIDDDENLNKLYQEFIQQLTTVSMFVSLKLNEITSRLLNCETHLRKLKARNIADASGQNDSLEPQHHHHVLITTSFLRKIDACSLLLTKISRFLIVQKIALRKLIKKFLKYYPNRSIAKKFVIKLQKSDILNNGYEGCSIISVDLDPYLLEVSLIIDYIYGTTSDINAVDDNGTLLSGSNIKNKNIPTSEWEFDSLLIGNCTTMQKLLVSQENIMQLKFILLKAGFLLVDDELLNTQRKLPLLPDDTGIHNDDSLHRTNDVDLNPNFILSYLNTNNRSYGNASSASNDKCVTECNIGGLRNFLITNTIPYSTFNANNSTSNPKVPLLRDSKLIESNSILQFPVNKVLLEWIKSKKLNKVDPNIQFRRTRFICNNSKLLNIDDTNHAQSSPLYLCTIDDQISICSPLYSSSDSHFWENQAFVTISKLPTNSDCYGASSAYDPVLLNFLSQLIDNKINSYPIKKSFWKLCYTNDGRDLFHTALDDHKEAYLYEDDELTSEVFYSLGLKMLQELTRKMRKNLDKSSILDSVSYGNKPNSSSPAFTTNNNDNNNNSNSNINNKKRDRPTIRYWNEFDDEEDESGVPFYYDTNYDAGNYDENSYYYNNGYHGERPQEFIVFSKNFIDAVYKQMFNQNDLPHHGTQGPNYEPSLVSSFSANTNLAPSLFTNNYDSTSIDMNLSPLLHQSKSYKSIVPSELDIESQKVNNSTQPYRTEEEEEEEEEDTFSVFEYKHDQVYTFFYLISLIVACLTSGIALGVIVAIFEESNSISVGIEMGTSLVITLIGSMLCSLGFGIFSVLLLFSRFSKAPLWHYVACFVLFIVVTCVALYGILGLIL